MRGQAHGRLVGPAKAKELYYFSERLSATQAEAVGIENLNRAVHGRLEECMDLEVTHHVHTGLTADHQDAALAFVETGSRGSRAGDLTPRVLVAVHGGVVVPQTL